MAYNIEEWYLELKNQRGLAPLSVCIGVIVIVLTTCLYCCCCCGVKRQKKSSVLGKIREVTVHSGGGKKKSFWTDPFRPSNLEYQRRFEDEITRFLYLVGVDIAQPLFDYYNITFMDGEGKILGENQKHTYLLDYRWILKHIAYNCRDYALILTKTRDRQVREKVIQLKDPGLTVQDVLEDLRASKERSDPELIVSIACRIKDLCHSLKDRANKRAHGSHLREELEEETSSRGREAIMTMMNEGLQLIELIKTAMPTTPKVSDIIHTISLLLQYYSLLKITIRTWCLWRGSFVRSSYFM